MFHRNTWSVEKISEADRIDRSFGTFGEIDWVKLDLFPETPQANNQIQIKTGQFSMISLRCDNPQKCSSSITFSSDMP